MFRTLFKLLERRGAGFKVRSSSRFRPFLEGLEDRISPAVLTVNSTTDSTSTGNNILTLREAVGLVNGALSVTAAEQSQVSGTLGSNDTIQFNLPSGPQTITLTSGSLTISRLVSINGPGASNLTINANKAGRAFVVNQISTQGSGVVTTIGGLDMAGGSASYGGALINYGTLVVNNCTFAGNTAGNSGGGGIFNEGVLTVSNSIFTGNTVTSGGSGGGIQNSSSSTLTVSNCVFTNNTGTGSGNSASQGAALANSGKATVSNSTFTGNTVTSDGGAIYQSSAGTMTVNSSSFINSSAGSDGGAIRNGGALTLNYCLFTGNYSASEGGAIDTSNSMTATGCTFAGNTAVSEGGAIEEESGGSAALYNTTITGNRVTSGDSSKFGGGIYNNSPVKLFNTIVAGNFQGATSSTTANDIAGSVNSSSAYNLIGTGGSGGLVNGSNNNQVGVSNPGLGVLANNGGPTQTVALLAGSPAIGRGSNAYVVIGETDQRGLPRVVNGTVDIGAFEVQTASTPTAASFSVTGFPASATAGTAYSFTVTARDSSGNVFTSYTGTVHITSSDSQASLPADYTFVSGDNGVHTFNVTLKTAGNQSLTATDTTTAGVAGTESGITVNPAVAAALTVTGFPSPVAVGAAGTLTVTAEDVYGNIASGYLGTVHFTSSDGKASLPADYTFVSGDNGVHTFSVTLNTTGTQSLTAADTTTSSITGNQSGIVVNTTGANGTVLTVNSTADSTSTKKKILTLREAVGLVDGTLQLTADEQSQVSGALGGSNETIVFNLPSGSQTITLTGGALNITHAVSINGPGAGNLTINGNNADRVFVVGTIYSQNLGLVVSMSGVTISGGSAVSGSNNYGGGLLNFGTLTVSNSTFTGNSAGNNGGGGIYNDGALFLNNDAFTNNTVTTGGSGGAILDTGSSTLAVNSCSFTGNTGIGTGSNGTQGAALGNNGKAAIFNSTFTNNNVSSDGGAIYNSSQGSLSINSSAFIGNTGGSDGGAIRNGGAMTLNYCLFTGNYSASEGGAIDTSNSMTATGCTFAGNTAVSEGGAIEEESGGSATLNNVTITGNRVTSGNSGQFGGGIYNNSSVKLFNTIVAGNFQGATSSTTANDIAGSMNSSSAYNLIGTGGSGGLVNGVNNNQVSVSNPGLGALANNGGPTQTVALLAGSPAIGRGSNTYVVTGETDQRGLPRVVNGTVDIGAFEVQTASTPTAASFSVTGFPASATAGTAYSVTVTAKDGNGNVVTGYTGTVHITSSDGQASLPADYTFVSGDNGVHTFNVTLKTAGNQSLTTTDTTTAGLTGTESGITVNPAVTTALTVTGFPSPVAVGAAGTLTVTADDIYGNIASGYLGTVHFTSSDSQASLPADYTFVSGDNGVHTFSVTLNTTGTQSLTATDSATPSITGSQSGITVNPLVATTFTVAGFSSPSTAGAAGTLTVTAKNSNGKVVTSYAGTVHFTASDSQAFLPADYTFVSGDNGVHTFNVTLKTAGTQSLTATDTTTAGLAGTESGITVSPAAAASLTVTGFPSPVAVGAAGTQTVTAQDTYGNIASGYLGTVHFTSSDSQASLPADYTFVSGDNGVHTFSVTLNTTGTQSLTATDTITASIAGSQSGITVNPLVATTFTVTGFTSPSTAGSAGTLTVTARAANGKVVTTYAGTVHFTSSDSQASLPADYTFVSGDNGVHTFNFTLKSAGSQSITATDTTTAGLTGTESGITVNPASAASLTLSGYPSPVKAGTSGTLTVAAKDAYGNVASGYLGTVHFTSSDSQASLPADYTFVSGDNGVHTFSLTLNTTGSQSLTATDTATSSTTGSQPGIVVNATGTNGTVLTVNSTADSTSTGTNILTLREAIGLVDGTLQLTAAEQSQVSGTLGGSNETIAFNLPSGAQTITLSGGALNITHAVSINGPGASNLTINGNNASRVFVVGTIYSQNLGLVVSMSGVTISGGSAISGSNNYGGGLLNFGTLTVSNSTFASNAAGNSGGGGLYNDGALTLNNDSFTSNTVASGGAGAAIQNAGSSTLAVNSCSFTSNTATGSGASASSGAGIANSGTATVSNSTFTGNTATSDGGAIYNSSAGTLTLSASTLTNNSAGSNGGGIHNDGTLSVSSSTLNGNSAASEGGGIDNQSTLVGMTNCTLYGNTAGSEGGGLKTSGAARIVNCTITANRTTNGSSGVYGGGICDVGTAAKLFNTIVAGNFQGATSSTTANDIAGSMNSSSAYNLIGTGGSGGLVNGVNNNQVGVSNLGLGALANNGGPTQTIALLAGSTAIDQGGNAYVTAGETDQRGLSRVVNGTVDIGAFEVQTGAA